MIWRNYGIEGTRRGTGDVEKPFYERYRFENENTLAIEVFADETLSRVTEVTRFELKGGQFEVGVTRKQTRYCSPHHSSRLVHP